MQTFETFERKYNKLQSFPLFLDLDLLVLTISNILYNLLIYYISYLPPLARE